MRVIFTLFLHAIVIIIRLGRPGGLTFCCCRIRLDATSTSDSESGSEAGSQPSVFGSHHRRFMHVADAASPCFAVRCPLKDLDSVAFSQDADSAKVPAAVFPQTSPSARSQRPDERTDRRGP